jgi:thiol-disulfide isomerase/thioredoxin
MLLVLGAGRAQAEPQAHVFKLRPGEAGSKLAPRYSPKGFKVPLVPLAQGPEEGHDHRQGRLRLGPPHNQGEGVLLVLARSEPGKPYDLLWIDRDRNGSVADEAVQRVKPRTSRGSVYTSYQADLPVNHGSSTEPRWESYAIGLWIAVESEEQPPAFIRFSRRGFLIGSVALDGKQHDIVLSDANNDAVFGEGDWWALLERTEGTVNDMASSRKVGDFAWAGGQAYKLELLGTAGGEARIVPFDPGITPEEDARKRDRYWDDKHAARAEQPVSFARDVAAALEKARAGEAFYFLDFETVWCGPCKVMDRLVYTAKDVAAAAKGILCIKVDGDEHKDLKARHKVVGFPTGILFDPQGKEVARFTGYQSVKQMTAFFEQVRAVRQGDPDPHGK